MLRSRSTLHGKRNLPSSPQQHCNLLHTAERLTAFVRNQNQRDVQQDVKKEWLLYGISLRTSGLQIQRDLLQQKGGEHDVAKGQFQDGYTALSVHKHEWGELQATLVNQVQTCRAQTPSRAALAELARQRSQMHSVAMTLDQEADAMQSELNNWPSALSPPDLGSMLAELQGHVSELTAQHVLASSQVRQQMQAAADDLHTDFQRRLAQWQQLVACHAAHKHAVTHTSWSRQQQDMFAYMSQSAAEEVAGVGKKGMRARIPLLMPGLSETSVMGAYDWQCKKKSLEQSSTALVSAWVRAEEALLSQAQQMLQQSAEEEQAHAAAAADRLEALVAQHDFHSELQVLRCEKYVTEALTAQRAELEQQAQLASEEEQQQKQQAYMAESKEQLAVYHAQQAEAQMQDEQAALGAAQQQQHEALIRNQFNEARTSFRQEMSRQQDLLQQYKKWQLQQQDAARQRRLDALRAQVQVHVVTDPDRVMAATAASSAQAADEEGAFAPVHGYTTDALLKDRRFKVLEALRQQSLQSSSYVKNALLAVTPATVPRRDTFTTVEKLL